MFFLPIRRPGTAFPREVTVLPATRRWGHLLASALLACVMAGATHAAPRQGVPPGAAEPLVTLARSRVMPPALREAKALGRLPASTAIQAGIVLPWRNRAELESLIRRQSDPLDPLYKKFLTREQFDARFAPTQADYNAIKSWAQSSGLSVDRTLPSRNLMLVHGSCDVVEAAFHVQEQRYQLKNGRVVYVNMGLPRVPQSIASRIRGVVGLDNYGLLKPHLRPILPKRPTNPLAYQGTGPYGGVDPADIRSLYDFRPLTDAGLDGSGQTVALYELDAYNADDVHQYATLFALPQPDIENILVNGFSGSVLGLADIEVTLDIEMVMAVAPKAKILVYEADQTGSDVFGIGTTPINTNLILLNTIANDNRASIVSISYGMSEEDAEFVGERQLENDIFTRMVAQGQCVYVSSGDSGAYNTVYSDLTSLNLYQVSVSDPASQPLVVAVGGTSLLGDGPGYGGETTWTSSDPAYFGGGGGGSSKYWFKPDYQAGLGTSPTMRDIPDVSLNADPNTGYSVFYSGFFITVGGTSASCPLWAAFNALVNQQRASFSLPQLGFANPAIYKAGRQTPQFFHDIADGSTNGVPANTAVPGFDDATGWGSYDAALLMSAFAPVTSGTGALTVQVTDASTGGPAAGVTVTAQSTQISGLVRQVVTAADGTATLTLPVQSYNFNGNGQFTPLTYTVSADALNKAGDVKTDISVPATVALTIRNTDHAYAASNGLQMISAPFDYSGVANFATLFGLPSTIPVSATGRPAAALFSWVPAINNYVSYPVVPADTLRLGLGYWALLPADPYVRRPGVPAPTNQPFRITVQPGWNMIGDPFQRSVPLSSIQVESLATGTSPTSTSLPLTTSPLVQMPLYTWNGSAYVTLSSGDSLQPFVGYWIFANQAANLVVPVQ